MQAEFWHKMWQSGVVGFHQNQINEFLVHYWPHLGLSGHEQILVPLCGKSLDMLWLRQKGHEVLGVELSQQALDEFLAENNISAQPVQHTHYCGYDLDGMTLLCGDFFHLSAEDCTAVKAVYDRAAIVALPPAMRQQYVDHLQAILPKGTLFLMVTMAYDQNLMQGPPFSVPEKEVHTLFSHFAKVEKVHQVTFERKGIETTEMVFVMQS